MYTQPAIACLSWHYCNSMNGSVLSLAFKMWQVWAGRVMIWFLVNALLYIKQPGSEFCLSFFCAMEFQRWCVECIAALLGDMIRSFCDWIEVIGLNKQEVTALINYYCIWLASSLTSKISCFKCVEQALWTEELHRSMISCELQNCIALWFHVICRTTSLYDFTCLL